MLAEDPAAPTAPLAAEAEAASQQKQEQGSGAPAAPLAAALAAEGQDEVKAEPAEKAGEVKVEKEPEEEAKAKAEAKVEASVQKAKAEEEGGDGDEDDEEDDVDMAADEEDPEEDEDEDEEEEDDEGCCDDEGAEESDHSYQPPVSKREEEDKDSDVEELKELNAQMGTSSSSTGAHPQDIHSCLLMQNEPAFRALLSSDGSLLLKKDRLGRTLLHLALLRGQADLVGFLLEHQDRESAQRMLRMPFRGAGSSSKDSLPVLHLALAVACHESLAGPALRCMELLLAQPQVAVNCLDNIGRTALHVACQQGASHILELLFRHSADPGLRDDLGMFPLHYAIDAHHRGCVESLLAASDPTLFVGSLHPLRRCIERQAWSAALLVYAQGWPVTEADASGLAGFAGVRGLASEWSAITERGAAAASGRPFEDVVNSLPADLFRGPSTALVTHPVCLGHGAIPDDVDDPAMRAKLVATTPENPHRLEVLCGERGVLRTESFRTLRWVHEPAPAPLVDVLRVHEYWYVHKLRERVKALELGGPFLRMQLDSGDTKVTRESWHAALRACGCVLEAVDMVCNEQVRNAFCAVRPPGHHLGPAGATNKKDLDDDPEGSQGFCLLNNVAVGAAYARCVYRHVVKKVAIIDFDIHHGNGTEAIVRHLQGKHNTAPRIAEISSRGFSTRIDLASPPSCKPWMDPDSDAQSVLFASIHGYGGGFYPGTGKDCNEAAPKIVNVALRPDSSSADFREGFRAKVLPELFAFNPDIVFVSAGFDGHEDDLIGNCHLVDQDFVWVTQQLVAVANRCCQGRLVSVLEGGYNSRAEALSPFAQAVAGHVRTLMHTSPNYGFLECEHLDDASLQQRDERWCSDRLKAKLLRKRKRRSGGSAAFATAAAATAELEAATAAAVGAKPGGCESVGGGLGGEGGGLARASGAEGAAPGGGASVGGGLGGEGGGLAWAEGAAPPSEERAAKVPRTSEATPVVASLSHSMSASSATAAPAEDEGEDMRRLFGADDADECVESAKVEGNQAGAAGVENPEVNCAAGDARADAAPVVVAASSQDAAKAERAGAEQADGSGAVGSAQSAELGCSASGEAVVASG